MFNLIGIGLSSPKDITLNGLQAIQSSSKIYLESYTSLLIDSKLEDLIDLYGKPIVIADREMIESRSDEILDDAIHQDISLLVVGDPFGATTHADLILRCKQKRIDHKVIHNVSIMNAIGSIGINLYNFGQTVSIPFFSSTWRPRSWFEKINENFGLGLHTLCLLDIKVKEQSDENLARGRKIYEPPRFMTIDIAIKQILSIMKDGYGSDEKGVGEENESREGSKNRLVDPKSILCIAACRLTSKTEKFLVGSLMDLLDLDPSQFGDPLHSLIILGHQPDHPNRLNPVEIEFLSYFAINKHDWLLKLTDPTSTSCN